ncbi:MAG: hypothetical protein QOD59_2564, partial [Mycobacterium sp.]|nr:hypothetical protein [Mycobacterium sp.]
SDEPFGLGLTVRFVDRRLPSADVDGREPTRADHRRVPDTGDHGHTPQHRARWRACNGAVLGA